MGVKLRVRRGVIHLVIINGGVRQEVSTGLHTSTVKESNDDVWRMAEILRSRKELEIVSHANGVIKETNVTLYAWCEKCNEDAGKTSKLYKMLPYLEKYGGREVNLSGVTARWYEIFQVHMRDDSGLSLWSAEKYTCMVHQCLRLAVRDSMIIKDPSAGVTHITVPESDKEPLTIEELRTMIATDYKRQGNMPDSLQYEIRKAFVFGCVTGLRIIDLTQLTWSKVDLSGERLGKTQQKTKKTVWIPLNKDAMLILKDGVKHGPEEYVFPELQKTKTTTNRYLISWAKAAGLVKHVTWHIARYTDANLLFDAGADLYTVQKLLGHSKIQTTAHYAKPTDKKKRAAVEALPKLGLDKKKTRSVSARHKA